MKGNKRGARSALELHLWYIKEARYFATIPTLNLSAVPPLTREKLLIVKKWQNVLFLIFTFLSTKWLSLAQEVLWLWRSPTSNMKMHGSKNIRWVFVGVHDYCLGKDKITSMYFIFKNNINNTTLVYLHTTMAK